VIEIIGSSWREYVRFGFFVCLGWELCKLLIWVAQWLISKGRAKG
jgi:hypothetical protein